MSDVPAFTKQYIDGSWVPSTNAGKLIDVFDSNTAKVCARVPDGSAEDMDRAVEAAHRAFLPWSATPRAQRKALVAKIIVGFQNRMPEIIQWLTKEVGCSQMASQHAQAPVFLGHAYKALELFDKVEWEKPAGKCTVVKEPIGVVGAITPWNWPLNQIAVKIIPALLCGCTVVLKPSEIAPINAFMVTEAVHEAGLPNGVFNMVCGTGDPCGEVLSRHPKVDMISFTGSTRAGKRISEVAAGTLKTVRTELGGKSAAIFLDDADFKKPVKEFMGQLTLNCGQSCNALTRFLVPRARLEEAESATTAFMQQIKVGRNTDKKASMGPLASQIQWDKVQDYLQKGVQEGAKLLIGGPGKPEGFQDGYFVKPTVFSNVTPDMTIAKEEIFGPVLAILPYDSEEEAIRVANDTIYGLNNAVASQDPARALKVASQLRSGTVMINTSYADLEAPFGGYKQSGNAREWGTAGLEEFLLTKTINLPHDVVRSKL